MSISIVTDSTADIPTEVAKELGITVIPIYLRFGNKTYRDGIDISHDEFYRKLRTSNIHPTTSQPTPNDFAQIYKELSRSTNEIISIHVTSKLSGTYNAALQGKEITGKPGSINVIDSCSVTMGLGMITMAAARLAAAGENLQTILEDVKNSINSTQLLGIFDTLKYLFMGGRIGRAKALLGTLLNVKPVLTMRDGELFPVSQSRTRSRAIDRLFDFAKNAFGVQELAVVHSTTPDEANSLAVRMASFMDNNIIHVSRLGPALGVHGGPGTLVVALRNKISDIVAGSNNAKVITSDGSSVRKISLPSIHMPKVNLPHR